MPKKKQTEPPAEQGKRFVEEAQRMIDAGELSPTEAERGMAAVIARQGAKKVVASGTDDS